MLPVFIVDSSHYTPIFFLRLIYLPPGVHFLFFYLVPPHDPPRPLYPLIFLIIVSLFFISHYPVSTLEAFPSLLADTAFIIPQGSPHFSYSVVTSPIFTLITFLTSFFFNTLLLWLHNIFFLWLFFLLCDPPPATFCLFVVSLVWILLPLPPLQRVLLWHLFSLCLFSVGYVICPLNFNTHLLDVVSLPDTEDLSPHPPL